MNITTMKPEKSSTDIYFAAALLALGYELKSVNKEDPRHMVFVFTHAGPFTSGELKNLAVAGFDDAETQWANGTLAGNFSKYAESIKRLKSVVHSK